MIYGLNNGDVMKATEVLNLFEKKRNIESCSQEKGRQRNY